MKKGLVLTFVLILVLAVLTACSQPAPTPEVVEKVVEKVVEATPTPVPLQPWEQIKWNEPMPMTERLLADEYVLPEGWQEATAGVDEIVFYNSGGMQGDIATKVNMMIFEQLTGIKLKNIDVGAGFLFAKTLSTLSSKDSSVAIVSHTDAPLELTQTMAAGWHESLDVLWPPEVQALYPKGLVDAIQWEGHFYGTCDTERSYLFFYRPSVLEAIGEPVPETWQDVYRAAKKAREYFVSQGKTDSYGIVFPGDYNLSHMLQAGVYSQGGRVLKNGSWDVMSPEFQNSWEYWVNLVREGIADEAVLGYTWEDYQKTFGLGKAAFMLGFSTYAMQFTNTEAWPELGTDWDVVAPPKWDASQPGSNRAAFIDFDANLINKFAPPKVKAAAMLWFDYRRSKQAQMYEMAVEGNESWLPATYEPDIISKVDWDLVDAAAKELDIKAPPHVTEVPKLEARRASAETTVMEAFPPGSKAALEALIEYYGRAVTGEMEPLEALQAANTDITKYLSPQ